MINTVKLFNETIERKFWDLVIPLMRKKPKLVEKLAGVGYYFHNRFPKRNLLIQSIFWICIGLSLGLGIGILIP